MLERSQNRHRTFIIRPGILSRFKMQQQQSTWRYCLTV
jgi:hypothetical protein